MVTLPKSAVADYESFINCRFNRKFEATAPGQEAQKIAAFVQAQLTTSGQHAPKEVGKIIVIRSECNFLSKWWPQRDRQETSLVKV